ncbi:MAG TPA: efflux RND transporter periplasmic adaptor subunit [Longimicrobiales bacterium]
MNPFPERHRAARRSALLLLTLFALGGGVAAWKLTAAERAADAGMRAEPVEVVTAAVATRREHRSTTTSIGTVLALRSVTLRNELPGTVRRVHLPSGRVVDAGTVLVELDVSAEQAELKALEARATLAQHTLQRLERLAEHRAISAIDLDNARAERDVALAEIERVRAIIARKTIRAPFRARVGIANTHPGQFLAAGTLLTTLQSVDDAAHVDFAVPQDVAAALRTGERVDVLAGDGDGDVIAARIVAIDSRVDPTTRNATVRARLEQSPAGLAPGASVRVRVPAGPPQTMVFVPVSALRKGPAGDHVFVLEADAAGQTRAHVRQVEAGPTVGDEVGILAGLEAGERVAASGSFKLREGTRVSIAAAAPTSARGEE